jgi:thioredoxin reductase (NADPH)
VISTRVCGSTISRMTCWITDRDLKKILGGSFLGVILGTELVSLEGESHLGRVTWLDRSSGERTTRDIRHVFVMAGASPHSDWLRGCVAPG